MEILEPDLKKMQDLKITIIHPDPVVPGDVITHSNTGLRTLIIILLLSVLAYSIYRCHG